MSADAIVSWAEARGLDPIPDPSDGAVLLPHEGQTGVWTTRATIERGWIHLEAMTDLAVDDDRVLEALRYVAMVGQVERVAAVRVDPLDGGVTVAVATLAPPGGADELNVALDGAWDASVRATDLWVPGLRDVASGIDPQAAYRRVTSLLGGPS